MPKKTLAALAAFFFAALKLPADPPPLVSGEPIRVGAPGGLGPLSLGLSNHPVGAVNLTGGPRPDLIVVVGAHSSAPGCYFLPCAGTAPTGAPVFGTPRRIPDPDGVKIPSAGAALLQAADGTVHVFILRKKNLLRFTLDRAALRLVRSAPPVALKNLPAVPGRLAAHWQADGSVRLFFSISEGGTGSRKLNGADWRSADYRPYDGRLVFTGRLGRATLHAATLPSPLAEDAAIEARPAAPGDAGVLGAHLAAAPVFLPDGKGVALIAGNRWGNLLHYTAAPGGGLTPARLAAGPGGTAYRTPAIAPVPVAYPDAVSGLPSALVVGGETALHYIAFTGEFSPETGAPVFAPPAPVLLQNARLYPGTLPVLSAVDWDGDGALDLISGNSEGQVLLFRNLGATHAPAFAPAVELRAGGEPIRIQQGYVNVQGPGEQRWGYSCPRAFDWNGDGLPDIVASSATARHEVFLNNGVAGAPALAPAKRLYCEGLDLHGTWRVQPALARMGGRVAYAALDDDDEFHLYWRVDDRNVADGGKLRLEDGSVIKANFLDAGGSGRLKLQFVDWDLDGRTDLIVGTPRHGSVPEPKTGLPQSLGLPGAAVLFLKNTGTDGAPRFAFPKLMRHKGRPIFHGQHACGPVATVLGDRNPGGAPNLLVGDQEGLVYYYAREHLSWE
jgi:hypothetical protein